MSNNTKVTYIEAPMSKVEVETVVNGNQKRPDVYLVVDNKFKAKTSPRFWKSFNYKFEVNDAIYNLFSHQEVIKRVADRPIGKESIRFAVESNGENQSILGLSTKDKPIITLDDAADISSKYKGENYRYQNGVVTLDFTPLSGENAFKIGGDEYKNKFVLEVPVDGFTKPRITLSLLRLICENGLVSYSPYFRSDVNVGAKNAVYTLNKAVEAYDNEKGYDALTKRVDSAQKSWASVYEARNLHDFLVRMGVTNNIMSEYRKMVGNVCEIYNIANASYVSEKRQRQLPSTARVNDLINFATEVATHRATPEVSRKIWGYLGKLITTDYDLEGTAEQVPDFKDLFLKAA